jgi:hypothetical protein
VVVGEGFVTGVWYDDEAGSTTEDAVSRGEGRRRRWWWMEEEC